MTQNPGAPATTTALQFDRYGGVEVLELREVPTPVPGTGEVLVRVRAVGINPIEDRLRQGLAWHVDLPAGLGVELAGEVVATGAGVTAWAVGAEVVGWLDVWAAAAQYAVVPVGHLVARPAAVPWDRAGAIFGVGAPAWASVRAVDPQPGEVVAVSGAAGGVGTVATQLAAERGARVIGIAGAANQDWLRELGVTPVSYAGGRDSLAQQLREAAPDGIDAFVDTFGDGYVDLAVELGVPASRINTLIDFDAAQRHGARSDGTATAATPEVVGELTARLADGRLVVPTRTYPLSQARDAYADLARRHGRGKIVLLP